MYCPKCRTEYRRGFTKCADCGTTLVDEQSPESTPPSTPKFERLITVGAYTVPYEANIAQGLLESEEIPSFLMDYYTIYVQWLYSNALGGVKLQVPEEYTDKAREILSDSLNAEYPPEFFTEGSCPRCGHGETEYILLGKRWIFLTWLLTGYPLMCPFARLRCPKCGYRWREND